MAHHVHQETSPTKRKERDGSAAPTPAQDEPSGAAAAGKWLLAGYLARQFLTTGTLLGQPWYPARPKDPAAEPARVQATEVYADVAGLHNARDQRAHIPGIVNPTQLARYLSGSGKTLAVNDPCLDKRVSSCTGLEVAVSKPRNKENKTERKKGKKG